MKDESSLVKERLAEADTGERKDVLLKQAGDEGFFSNSTTHVLFCLTLRS